MYKTTLLFLIFISMNFCEGSIKESLSSIPKTDQKKLEQFFRQIIYKDAFGYTIWGKKPVTSTYWKAGLSPKDVLFKSYRHAELEEFFSVWKKYRELFPMEKFIFFDHYFRINDDLFHTIILINKNECKKLCEKYPKILNESEIQSDLLTNNSMPNHLKLGLYYGFGLYNTKKFLEYNKLKNTLAHLPVPPYKAHPKLLDIHMRDWALIGLNKKDLRLPANIDQESIVANYLSLKKNFIHFSKFENKNPFNPISLPAFTADMRSEESKRIYQKYSKEREIIVKMTREPNFLEILLEKLCEN